MFARSYSGAGRSLLVYGEKLLHLPTEVDLHRRAETSSLWISLSWLAGLSAVPLPD